MALLGRRRKQLEARVASIGSDVTENEKRVAQLEAAVAELEQRCDVVETLADALCGATNIDPGVVAREHTRRSWT